MNTYVDVRGPQPILFIGLRAYELMGAHFNITVQEALLLIS